MDDANKIEILTNALKYYARCGNLYPFRQIMRNPNDVDLADVSEKLTEDAGDVARRTLRDIGITG